MSVVNSVGTIAGIGCELYQKTSVVLSGTGQQTNTISSISPAITRGKWRAKVSAGLGTSPTLVDLTVNCTDGTTTVTIFKYHPSTADTLSSTAQTDLTQEFLVDINANSFSCLTTLGGTSPLATLDFEVEGAP